MNLMKSNSQNSSFVKRGIELNCRVSRDWAARLFGILETEVQLSTNLKRLQQRTPKSFVIPTRGVDSNKLWPSKDFLS